MTPTFTLERPIVAVDGVMFTFQQGHLQVLLHQRQEEPFRLAWTLPGVAVRVDESLETAAQRALTEKLGVSPAHLAAAHLEQLATFGGLYRDPRGRTISVVYLSLTRPFAVERAETRWQTVTEVLPRNLPFDHDEILQTAVRRLQGKLRYTNIARTLLPETFRIEELHTIYEGILGQAINLTNFRVKLLKIQLIEQVRVLTGATGKHGGRPPHIYRFTQTNVEMVPREFL
jgi:8-oxo-dGTP diphosphatase